MMKYALFGAGQIGKRYFTLIKDEYDVECFIDSDREKWGTSFMGVAVISPSEAAGRELAVIIAVSSKYWLEVMRRLHESGIKEFYLPESYHSLKLKLISLAAYTDVSEKSNKICVMRHGNAGIASTALIKCNPFDDIEVVIVNSFHKDDEYYYQYLTSSLIITHGFEPVYGDKKTIELWHGFTIKTIGYMNGAEAERPRSGTYWGEQYTKNVICSLSKLYSIFTGYCTKMDYDNFYVTGYPRNDMIFRADGKTALKNVLGDLRQRHVIFYAPTYREANYGYQQNGKNSFIFNMQGYGNSRFDNYLKKHNILFIYKMHTLQKETEAFAESDNIRRITDDMLNGCGVDLYEILNGTDCLISDYSSLIIDYLLTDKPMVFTPTDLEEYEKTRGLMLEPYDAWMPGEIALDYEQLEKAITASLFGKDPYKKDRERLRRITHKYADGNSTRRVLALARELLGIETSGHKPTPENLG